MQTEWLRAESSQDLIIYILGWAATPNAVAHIEHPAGFDVLACFNYTELHPLKPADFSAYRRIYLFAWSFGIWVAEQTCRELPLYRAVALNGTPHPTDERYGMRLRIVLRAMRGIAAGTAAPTTDDGSGRYMPTVGEYPDPTPSEKIAELEWLAARSREHTDTGIRWDKAYIADKDEIFPPARMWDYWQQQGLGTGFDSYHYPFASPSIVMNELL